MSWPLWPQRSTSDPSSMQPSLSSACSMLKTTFWWRWGSCRGGGCLPIPMAHSIPARRPHFPTYCTVLRRPRFQAMMITPSSTSVLPRLKVPDSLPSSSSLPAATHTSRAAYVAETSGGSHSSAPPRQHHPRCPHPRRRWSPHPHPQPGLQSCRRHRQVHPRPPHHPTRCSPLRPSSAPHILLARPSRLPDPHLAARSPPLIPPRDAQSPLSPLPSHRPLRPLPCQGTFRLSQNSRTRPKSHRPRRSRPCHPHRPLSRCPRRFPARLRPLCAPARRPLSRIASA